MVRLRNAGPRAGSEVVQLYRHSPELALVGFAKATLAPGEERELLVPIEPRLLRVWDGQWRNLPNNLPITVARNSAHTAFNVTMDG